MYTKNESFRDKKDRVKAAAAGRWPELLQQLGVPAKALSKANKPCPACGGKDRFSFEDDGRGAFVCRAMDKQGGDGFELLMHLHGYKFIEAVNAVEAALGLSNGQTLPQYPRGEATPQARALAVINPRQLAKVQTAWDKAKPIAPLSAAGLYLKGRALPVNSPALRFEALRSYWQAIEGGKPVELGRWPAMLAQISNATGEMVGIHQTFLNPMGQKAQPTAADGAALPAKKISMGGQNLLNGCAVRLAPPAIVDGVGVLGVAEGIETALAASVLFGVPVWSCLSASGLRRVILPPEITEVWIFADNDTGGAGQSAAQELQARLAGEGRAVVRLLIPDEVGTDWADVLAKKPRAAR